MFSTYKLNIRERLESSFLIIVASLFALAVMTPILLPGTVGAAQLTNRSVTIGTSEASATTTYQFSFQLPTSVDVQGVIFEFCTNPLGACTLPTGMDVSGATYDAGTWSEATVFTIEDTAAGACDDDVNTSGAAATQVCIQRVDTDSETAAPANKSVTLGSIVNPSTTSIDDLYVRVATYNDTAYASNDHNGTVAAAIVDQLTVTGRVQERLQFCVASVADDDAADTTVQALSNVAGCVALTDTTVDIGVIDNSSVALAPVPTGGSTLGDDEIGIAMINTNGSGGTSLTYYAEPVPADNVEAINTETDQMRSFRVHGATVDCSATETTYTDQCFRSADNAGITVNPANEYFGMYVPCVDTSQGTVATTMDVKSAYDGQDNDETSATDCENEDKDDIDANNSQVLSWNDTGTADEIADSTGVLDDVVVKFAFGAAAAPTTPTGTYSVVSTYIATPTF